MHTCVPVFEIARTTTATYAGGALFRGFTQAYKSVQLNLTSPSGLLDSGTKIDDVGYTSPVYDLIASAFTRYKLKKVVFHYEPQSSATSTERLVFAFAPDPLHPILWNASTPDLDDLLALSDSIAFAPWRGWSMDVSDKLDDTLMYTFSQPSTAISAFDERFSDFGVISCITSSGSTGSTNTCGILYMELMVELTQFCPISSSAVPAAKHLLPKLQSLSDKSTYRRPSSSASSSRDNSDKDCPQSPVTETPTCAHKNVRDITTKTGFNYRVCDDCDSILHK